MYCKKCGAELPEGTSFCSNCGKKIESAEVIVVSETKTDSAVNPKTAFKKGKFSKVLIGFAIFGVLCILLSFSNGDILSGLIAVVMTGLFAVSYLMGMQIIKEKQKGLRILSAVIAFVLIIPYFNVYNPNVDDVEKFNWQDIVMCEMLPEPESNIGEITSNSKNELMIDIHKISNKQYSDYLDACKEMGYIIDNDEMGSSYSAFNQSGYKLTLSYYESNEEMSIRLDTPMETTDIKWPDSDIGKLLPVPKSSVGSIYWENSDGFVICVADTPITDYNEYVKACTEKGFNVDYQKGDDYYYADNGNGAHLSLNYQGFNIMCVRIENKKEDGSSEINTTVTIDLDLEASSDTISVEVGDTLYSESFSQWESIENYEKLLFVSEDESVAKIEFASIENGNTLYVSIEGVAIGETYVYVKSEDETAQSEKMKVIVKEATAVEEPEEPETPVEDEPVDNSRTVYVTPYGKKYHYSQSCAGSNASATTEDSVEGIYDPCKKCAQ